MAKKNAHTVLPIEERRATKNQNKVQFKSIAFSFGDQQKLNRTSTDQQITDRGQQTEINIIRREKN